MKTKKDLDEFWVELVEKTGNVRQVVENNPKEFVNLNILNSKTPTISEVSQLPSILQQKNTVYRKKKSGNVLLFMIIMVELILFGVLCYIIIFHYGLFPNAKKTIENILCFFACKR